MHIAPPHIITPWVFSPQPIWCLSQSLRFLPSISPPSFLCNSQWSVKRKNVVAGWGGGEQIIACNNRLRWQLATRGLLPLQHNFTLWCDDMKRKRSACSCYCWQQRSRWWWGGGGQSKSFLSPLTCYTYVTYMYNITYIHKSVAYCL